MSGPDIKIGDRVVCVDDSASFRRLRAGDVYAVVANFDGSPTVMVGGASHSLERFRKVEEVLGLPPESLGGDVVAGVDHFEVEAEYHAARDQMPEDGSVGPFPVEPPPGLSAAQRRLVGEGWRFMRWGSRDASVALMESPGGVTMWCYPNGSKVFGDDGEAARVARERNGDKLELPDGRVQGVDRG